MRPSNVMAKASSAAFGRFIQRFLPPSGGVQTAHNEVETLWSGLLGGEMSSGAGRPSHPGVERLNGVGIGYEMGGTLGARTGSGSRVRDSSGSGCCGGTAWAGRSIR